MIDWKKLARADRIEVDYQCNRCGDVETFTLELPGHMLTHRLRSSTMQRCWGAARVARREARAAAP